jgi:putative DNA primase/helicase
MNTNDKIANIPDELKALKQWICLDYKNRPIDVLTGGKAEVDNPSTWCTFGEAQQAVTSGKYRRTAFVLSKDDPYTLIELRDVINPKTHKIESWAQEIIDRMNSYTEISEDGTSIHIIVKGKIPVKNPVPQHGFIKYFD